MSEATEEIQMISFQIILHAGNARSYAMEAIALAKDYRFREAREKIADADEAFNEAHHMQTKLLQEEASGNPTVVTVILVHAQDHLMTAMTVKDLANEMITMYEKIEQVEGKQ
ncbi:MULTISPECIES: PTS lactose/cellobiose transporter subunit IIA [unclassified Virgibacillus]|uniref:PTS lactose/cellobiose transporter subunit IIA n=1 Tax=unclassified Virgibacillus TaxID=2620237 RepID=UPI0024DE363D|nr:PTS lactose/cellobiose transporter subunit IIA [Virgibacillus sp. LDC-1]